MNIRDEILVQILQEGWLRVRQSTRINLFILVCRRGAALDPVITGALFCNP